MTPEEWAAWKAKGQAGAQGVNRMPGVFSNYPALAAMHPDDIRRLFYRGSGGLLAAGGGMPAQGSPAGGGQQLSSPLAQLVGVSQPQGVAQGFYGYDPYGYPLTASTFVQGNNSGG